MIDASTIKAWSSSVSPQAIPRSSRLLCRHRRRPLAYPGSGRVLVNRLGLHSIAEPDSALNLWIGRQVQNDSASLVTSAGASHDARTRDHPGRLRVLLVCDPHRGSDSAGVRARDDHQAQRLSTATRVGWLVVVVLLPVVGSILWLLYYRAVARLPRQSTEAQSVGAEL
ncbi:PLDc N-terminal domain-containing protein [Rathayibacter tanaceti]|uniref:PLDc N-terminal domain-containing protein n=1 Tax=Rathayibacter tanaceti TaxID=1671680 RepID=UPI0039B7353F